MRRDSIARFWPLVGDLPDGRTFTVACGGGRLLAARAPLAQLRIEVEHAAPELILDAVQRTRVQAIWRAPTRRLRANENQPGHRASTCARSKKSQSDRRTGRRA